MPDVLEDIIDILIGVILLRLKRVDLGSPANIQRPDSPLCAHIPDAVTTYVS